MLNSSEVNYWIGIVNTTMKQSRLMLEALEAPLADSRAAAVNIRLISCIGRQAKIGFCLQTRNSFNLLWSQCKSRFKIIEAKPLMSAQERRRNSEITTLDSLNPNLVLLARQSLTISLSATGSQNPKLVQLRALKLNPASLASFPMFRLNSVKNTNFLWDRKKIF